MPPRHDDCHVAALLRTHLAELREREERLTRMVDQERSPRRTSVRASLEARLQIVSGEISDLENLLRFAAPLASIPR